MRHLLLLFITSLYSINIACQDVIIFSDSIFLIIPNDSSIVAIKDDSISTNYFHDNIHKKLIISNVKFFDTLQLNNVQIKKNLHIINSKFEDEIIMNYIRFDSICEISETEFSSNSFNHEITFNYKVAFFSSIYKGNLVYSFSKFSQHVDWSGSKFDSIAQFAYCEFEKSINFVGANFGTLLDFQGSHLESSIFQDAVLPDTLFLANISLGEELDLTNTILDSSKEHCFIELYKAPIDKINLRYGKFKLLISDPINSKTFENYSNVYERLLRNFRNRGYTTSYSLLDREYQEFKFIKNPDGSGFDNFLNWFNKHWNDYGYNRALIWRNTGFLFLIFYLINLLRFPQLLNRVYTIKPIVKAFNGGLLMEDDESEVIYPELKNKALYLARPFLTLYYTLIIFFGLKMSIEQLNFSKPFSVLYIFIQYIVGLICLAYLANFVITSSLIGA